MNIKLVNTNINKTDYLEANIIRLLIDNKLNIRSLEACSIGEIIDKENSNSIYNNNINMLIFASYEMQSFFYQISKKILCNSSSIIKVYNENYIIEEENNDSINDILLAVESMVFSIKNKVGNNFKIKKM